MPSHCDPWPGKTSATFAGPRASPTATPSAGSPLATASSPASSAARPAPATAARCAMRARPAASDQPTSTGSSSGRASTCARRRRACAASASGVLADNTQGTAAGPAGASSPRVSAVGAASPTAPAAGPASPRASAASPRGASSPPAGAPAPAGASSSTTWAFVPLIPKPDTPARRGRSPRGHGAASVSSSISPADQSTCGVGASTCSVGASTPARIAMSILMTPATPAAACEWPMFDFTEPSRSGAPARSRPYVASSACASIGSPSVVPVPCASTASTSPGRTPAFASAWRMTCSCDGPLGAESPLLAPSWFVAVPRTRPSTRWPRRRASDRRSRTSTPAPSAQLAPSAAAANALLRPSGARPRWRLNSTNMPGEESTVTPPASASEHSPERSAWQARCSETSDDEQAVSTVTAGPCSPSA